MSSRKSPDLRAPYLNAAEELRENDEQWRAYESNGNCVVLAGPGSGKTKTLTTKFARMLSEDVSPPRGIACITYSTECADELKRRLDRLGIRESRNVFIGTIHSFCLKHVVLPYAKLAGLELPAGLAVAVASEQEKAFEEALHKVHGKNARPSEWRTDFDKYRRTHLDRDAPEWMDDDSDMARMIEAYEQGLRNLGLVDFDDMVLLGLRLIEGHAWIRKCVQARYPILVVDEYQDLGMPLHRIVLALCFEAGVRLFAVGDPDQSIYSFAGAKPELLSELAAMEGVEKIQLRFNYRSGQTLINASEVALGESRGFKARSDHKGTIDFYKYANGLAHQAKAICEDIIPKSLKRLDKRSLGDVAVLYLDRYDGDVIEAAARTAGLKTIRIDKGAAYAKTPFTRWIEACASWCAGGWAHNAPRLSSLIRNWEGFNPSLRAESDLYDLKLKLVRFLFAQRSPHVLANEWLERLRIELLTATFGREPMLRDEAIAFKALSKACGTEGKLHDLTVAALGGHIGAKDHLSLITLHSAKGLEFDVVVMMGMDQGRIPNWRAKTPDNKREPRRLFYVGITRARHEVHLTCSGFTVNGSGRRFDSGPSEFLLEVRKQVLADR